MAWTGPPMPRRAPWLGPVRPITVCCEYVPRPRNGRWWCPWCGTEHVRPPAAREAVEKAFLTSEPPAHLTGPVRRSRGVSRGQGTLL